MDSKSEKCIFIGYKDGLKGYKHWNPVTRKVVYNRDVVFTPDGNHTDVVVTGTDLEGTMIQFEQTLQTWVLRRSRHGKRESVVFFDQGLEILLRLALNISPLSEPSTPPTGRVL